MGVDTGPLPESLQDELLNFQGVSAVPHIVRWRGSLWFTATRSLWQELLVWRLASGWLNVPLAKAGPEISDATTPGGEPAGPFTGPLIRLAQTYSLDELRVRANDEAIASELIFCLWVRRRDPHAWNRAYVDGVPMFFDQHVAFDGRALDDFFELGDAGSHPPRWRVRTFDNPDEVPTTRGERDIARPIASEVGLHRVKSLSTFNAAFEIAAEHIDGLDRAWIAEQVERSGAPRDVYDLLERTRAELPAAMKRLRNTLFD